MTVPLWRIAALTPAYSAEDMSGGGAKATGGRWNAKGVAVLYTSENRSLACLETLVHVVSGALPLNRVLVRIDVPDDVWQAATYFDPDDPKSVGWDVEPAGMSSIDAGTDWANSGASALLVVPSVLIPEEANVLINPAHPDAAKITATKIRKWTYDARLKQ
ncbi:RES family NAD+ phosphorylase [Trinickia fusca]|uniref:RES domain-containing protein n=1 Tax=Trinickia fusca TaxID=2419777 RepID=A0A494XS17_9BURK|nr:RES family NAD+ phosphorylase [Trinickia fusca]RKP50889.1 RES domain-containing protein [Trinickia fusca]